MATRYTLDQLREDVEAKYGPFVLELGDGKTVTLHPIMRLPQDRRERFAEQYRELQAVQRKSDDGDAGDVLLQLDQVGDHVRGLLATVAATPADADRLMAVLPADDTTMALELFEQYAGKAMPGEASPSPS